MLAHARTRAAAVARQTASSKDRWGRLAAAAALVLLIAACTPVPSVPLAGPDPANPHARVPALAYRSPVEPYVSRRPVDPLPWQGQSDRSAPASKPGG
jgi:hypothetical protein